MSVPELVVAIGLLGLLVAISGSLLSAAAAGGRAVDRAGVGSAEAGASLSALRVLLAGARADEGRTVFEGDARHARFTSLCSDALGDLDRCAVTLTASVQGMDGLASIDHWSGSQVSIKLRGTSFAYLPSGGDRQWTSAWESPEAIPAAMALVTGTDTVHLRVGRP